MVYSELILGFLLGLFSTVIFHLYTLWSKKERAEKMLKLEVYQIKKYLESIVSAQQHIRNNTFLNITPTFHLASEASELQYLKESIAMSIVKINSLLKQAENFRLSASVIDDKDKLKARLYSLNSQYVEYICASEEEMKNLIIQIK